MQQRNPLDHFASSSRLAIFVALAAMTGVAAPAAAQLMEEITVTAQRREQSLQDVAISVSAFTGEQLEALGFERTVDIVNLTPGVTTSGSIGGSNAQFTIRGVTQNDFLETAEGPTAIYLDEGLVIQQNAGTFGLFDVERVEVLKGPQGTLFGRNATGGLVHFITRKPTEEPEAYVDATYGRFQQVQVKGALSGPISERVRARAAYYFNRHDAFLNNTYDEQRGPGEIRTVADLPQSVFDVLLPGASPADFPDEVQHSFQDDKNNDDTLAGRLSFEVDLAENLQLYIMGHGSRIQVSEAIYQSRPTIAVVNADGVVTDSLLAGPNETREAIGPGGVGVNAPFSVDILDATRPVPGGDFFGYVDPDGPGFDLSSDFSPGNNNVYEMYGTNVNLDWARDDLRVVSITDFKRFKRNGTVDIDAAPVDQLAFNTQGDTTSVTQEFRVEQTGDRLNWVAGLYYLYSDAEAKNGFIVSPTSVFLPFLGGLGPIDAVNEVALETNSYSAFGQIDYEVVENVTLTGGIRIIQEEKDYSYNVSLFSSGNDPIRLETDVKLADAVEFTGDPNPADPFVTSTSNTLWSAKLGVSWTPVEDVLLFATVNRGVKAGNFNAILPLFFPNGIPEDRIAYDREVLWAYEIGLKSTIFNGLARLNASAYYYDYNDYQAARFIGGVNIVDNADATIYGGEIELSTSPVEGLELFTGISAFDATVKDIALGGRVRDLEPSFAPELQWSGLARYGWDVYGGEAAIQIDGSYRSKFFNNLTNFTSTEMKEAWLANAQISYMAPEDRWGLTVFVKNFMDARNEEIGFDFSTACGCSEIAYSDPRIWGVRLHLEFF